MKVVFTEQSLDSLQEALFYLLNELELPKHQVLKIKNQLLSKAENLAFHPFVGQKEEYLDHLEEDHRRMVEGCFKIIYKVKMKSYVAVQKKLLTTIYALWKKNMPFIEDYQKIISKEQELYSPVSFEKAEKSSAEQVGTTQGKHPSELSQYASSPVIQS